MFKVLLAWSDIYVDSIDRNSGGALPRGIGTGSRLAGRSDGGKTLKYPVKELILSAISTGRRCIRNLIRHLHIQKNFAMILRRGSRFCQQQNRVEGKSEKSRASENKSSQRRSVKK